MKLLHRGFGVVIALLLGFTFVAPVAQAGDQVGYNDGFFIKSADDDFELKFNSTFKTQWQGVIFDGAGAANTNTFNIAVARQEFRGHAFGPEWTYEVVLEAAGAAVTLLDYWVDWMYSESFHVRVGEFRVPYSREFMTDIDQQQFANRSILGTGLFGNVNPIIGRELGISIWGQLAEESFEYYLTVSNGFANGTGLNTSQGGLVAGSTDIDMRYTLRGTYHLMGNHGLWYSDMGMSEEPHLALSAGVNYNRLDIDGDLSFDDVIGVTADLIYAMAGFSFAAEYHLTRPDGSTAGDTTNHAVLIQTGYFLNENAEVAARFVWLEPDAGTTTYKPGAVLNWYIHGRNALLQFQYEVAIVEDGIAVGDDAMNHEGIINLQFAL